MSKCFCFFADIQVHVKEHEIHFCCIKQKTETQVGVQLVKYLEKQQNVISAAETGPVCWRFILKIHTDLWKLDRLFHTFTRDIF